MWEAITNLEGWPLVAALAILCGSVLIGASIVADSIVRIVSLFKRR